MTVKRKSNRGHGGVCLFVREALFKGVEILDKDPDGFIWLKLNKTFFSLEFDICICFAYIPPSESVYFKSHDIGFFEKLEQNVRLYSDVGKIAIVGDLNARTGVRNDFTDSPNMFDMYIDVIDGQDHANTDHILGNRTSEDSVCNSSGLKLLELCKSTDIRILNGRMGEDDGLGLYTFLSSLGKSVIDYALTSIDLFPLISNFIVHDCYTFSSHVPIQMNISANFVMPIQDTNSHFVHKLKWDASIGDTFNNTLIHERQRLDDIVSSIISNDVDISDGVRTFGNVLYDCAFNTCGVSRRIYDTSCVSPNTKPVNQWFTHECKTAKSDLNRANKQYRKHRTHEYSCIVIDKRRYYKRVKRQAIARYKNKQKSDLQHAAKNNPKRFWDLIRKYKKTNVNNNNITAQEFFNHFKELFSENDIFVDQNVENDVNGNAFNDVNVASLDIDFSIEEILKAISKLKRNKSSGDDKLIAEIFIDSKHIIAPSLRKLFNFIFNSGVYPESWTRGVIVPVPKKGDKNNVDNYRGIMLTSIFSKLFSLLLDVRASKFIDENNILTECQFGFRKQKSTIDCIFVLQSIINKVIYNEKKKLYCAFVDFKKAFDTVYRNGIWYKLMNSGFSCKFIKMLKSMYCSVKTCVKVNGNLSDYFDSYMGVKQGETLSPLLFIMFINDMEESLYDVNADIISLNELQIFMLLFADDTVLFSYSVNGLQILLNNLKRYCTKWNITVNTTKTVAMVFKPGTRTEHFDVYYNDCKLTITNRFVYLGVTLSSNGKFYNAQKAMSEQALRAIYTLNTLFKHVALNVNEKIKLFDTMIMPILNYGSEIWGFHKSPDIEKVYIKFLKQVLHVRPQTTNATVYGELGKIPLDILRKERILKYWSKIINNPGSLVHKAFIHQRETNDIWVNNVRVLLNNLGFTYLWDSVGPISISQMNNVIERLHDQYYQTWYSSLDNLPKLSTYRTFKHTIGMEKYLNSITNDNHRIALTRIRCSAHKLAIEEGRFRNIERNNRKCLFCNMNVVEDEYHFILVCPCFRDIRKTCLPNYFCHWPTKQKFINLLSSSKTKLINKLAKYIYTANLLRESLLN